MNCETNKKKQRKGRITYRIFPKTHALILSFILIICVVFPIKVSNGEETSNDPEPTQPPQPPLTDPIAQPQILTIDKFASLLFTEVDSEFGFDTPVSRLAAQSHWAAASTFEWNRAFQLEYQNKVAPFVICSLETDRSGYLRRTQLLQSLRSAPTSSLSTITLNRGRDVRLSTIYNRENQSCFMVRLLASDARYMAGISYLSVQPMIYATKLIKDSIQTLTALIETNNNLLRQTDSNDEENETDNEEDPDTDKNSEENMLKGSPNNPTFDIGICPGVYDAERTSFNVSSWSSEDDFKTSLLEYLKTDILQDLYWSVAEAIEADEVPGTPSRDPPEPEAVPEIEMTEDGAFWLNIVPKAMANPSCRVYYNQLNFYFENPIEDDDVTVSMSISFPRNFGKIVAVEENKPCLMHLLLGLSLMPEICSVQVRPPIKLFNTNAQWITQSDRDFSTPFFQAGITGFNQTVSVSDTGLDNDNCYFVDTIHGVYLTKDATRHTSMRKIMYYDSYMDSTDTRYGHGTHVCGTIAGNKFNGKGLADGVAPDARLAFVDIGNEFGQLALPPMFRMLGADRPDTKIHNIAWGTEFNYYGSIARNLDTYMYKNEDFLIVVAAGNREGGLTGDTISDPATSKNPIVVGSSQSHGGDIESGQKGKNYLSSFSMRGPTRDDRTKPDVVAPGSWILSAGALPNQILECDTDPSPQPGQDGIEGLIYKQGTSMAAAVTSGTAALVRQYFEDGFWPSGRKRAMNSIIPSGTLVKAALMSGAQFLEGIDNSFAGISKLSTYDSAQNFGRIDLHKSLYLSGVYPIRTAIWDNQVIRDQDSKTYNLRYSRHDMCTTNEIRITLVWTDPPGAVGCRACLLNDLDLSAIVSTNKAQIRYPNDLPSKDSQNNAERIIVKGLFRHNTIKFTVKASNLITATQKYSIVISGCVDEVAFYTNAGNVTERTTITLGMLLFVLGFCCIASVFFNEARVT